MKVFGKCIGISVLCGIAFLGFTTKAATGDTTSTGSISTGTVATGVVGTGTVSTGTTSTGVVYTGSLLTYLDTQESSVNTVLTNTYGQLYTAFIKTGLNILKSIEYQSLVCLGAIKDVSLLSQLQKDKTSLTIAFKKDFIELENQVLSLEEKQALQESDNVNMFDSGTTYESEKVKLKNLIDAKVSLHKGFINTFASTYATKNTDFLTTYLQYRTVNADLVKGIQDKMTKVQSILTAFSGVESMVGDINAKVTGLDDLMKKIEDSKTKGLANLDNTLQTLIETNAKKYKKLQTLADELLQQKGYVIGQYKTDLDEYLNNSLQNRYNRTKYLELKNEVATFKSKFYTPTNQLNCSNILSTSDESAALLTKINAMKIAVNSGLVKITTDGISTTFKDQLYSGFQSLYLQKFKQRYTEYINYIKEYISTAVKNLAASLVPVIPGTTTTGAISNPKIPKYVFTKPFKSGEYGEGVKVLQNLLTTLQLYSGAIDGVYNKATKDAVYKFQLSKGLLKGYEKKPEVWGRMGPSTRNALNQLTK